MAAPASAPNGPPSASPTALPINSAQIVIPSKP
jgi:hypothetical protein